MNKKETEQEVQRKKDYVKPEVELFHLGKSLNFLEKGFSAEGYLGDLEDGGEFGDGYEGGNGIADLGDGGEFGN